ncbi:MAG: sensor histidine kinase, partial [Planctomycetota bacterium]
GMKLSLQLISRLLPAECEQAHAEIEQLRSNVRRSAIQMRDLSKRLRPPTLDQLGFENALNQLASDFENRGDIRFHIFSVRDLPQLPDEMATAFYRIAQEALTNVIRHAQATDVWLRVTFDGLILRLEIEDNGTGFDTESAHHGLGLLGMRERVAILGGVLDIESTSDGTKIRAGVTLDG